LPEAVGGECGVHVTPVPPHLPAERVESVGVRTKEEIEDLLPLLME
jgi:hypothetical protein